MQRGVFVKSKRSPILTMDNRVIGPCSPSLKEFIDSGRLLSDPVHSLAAITNLWQQDNIDSMTMTPTNLSPERNRNF